MKSENKYIGDEKFTKMLEHYDCPTPLSVVKMKFLGAVCSPNLELRPTDVISSLWEEGKEPRLETKAEADLFFKYFMGLWDEVFEDIRKNKVKLTKLKINNKENLEQACHKRIMEVEFGYVEGFWGGKDNIKIPSYVAELIDSLSEIASVYNMITKKLDKVDEINELQETFNYSDKMVEKAISFIIENQVLPRIEDLKRTVQ